MSKEEEIISECNKMWGETKPKDRVIFVTHLIEAKKQIEDLNNKLKDKDLKFQEQLEQKSKEKENLQVQLIEKNKEIKKLKEENELLINSTDKDITERYNILISEKDKEIKNLYLDNIALNALLQSLGNIDIKTITKTIIKTVTNEIREKAQCIRGQDNKIYCINLLDILNLMEG